MIPPWLGPGDGLFDDGGRGADPVDEQLVRVVARRLLADPHVRARRLHVTAQNRVVIMEGGVDSHESKLAASRTAWSTPGVFDVSNRLVQP